MKRFSHIPKTDAIWKGLRKHDITSTESAALFGLSPYLSKFELYHRKRRKDITDIQMNDRMLWGQRMERIIAEGIGADNGVLVRNIPDYVRIVRSRMGATFDFEIVGFTETVEQAEAIRAGVTPEFTILQKMYLEHGPGLFEIKATGYVEFRDKWIRNDDKTIEAPGHIEIQLQHQLHVADKYHWGAIGVLVAGNTPKVTTRLRDHEVGNAIETACVDLWSDIRDGKEPDPTYPDDAGLVKLLNAQIEDGRIFDGRGNDEFAKSCRRYRKALDIETFAKGIKETEGSKIAAAMQSASRALVDGFNVSRWVVGETEVPAYTRAAYPSMKITRKKAQ